MELGVLLEPELKLTELARVLDELGLEGRIHAVRQWDKAMQARLFEAAAGLLPLDMDFLVPQGTEVRCEVRHHGHNSLPMFNRFEKRFCKLPAEGDGAEQVIGYNFSPSGLDTFIGPGYFVVRPSAAEGELVIDYTQLPTDKCESWPAILPNSAKLGRFVYEGMLDHLRGLSSTVSIGRAERGGKMTDNYFVLVRQDPA